MTLKFRTTIQIPTFRTLLVFIIDDENNLVDNHNEIREFFPSMEPINSFDRRGSSYDIIINKSGYRQATVLIHNQTCSHGVIAHELLHATNFILRFANIEPSEQTEEVFASLLEYITQAVYEDLSDNEILILKKCP